MFYKDKQCEIPVSHCECCQNEIFGGDMVYDLAEVYMGGRHVVHEDCMTESIEQNKILAMEFLLSDTCLLKDIFDSILTKRFALEIFDFLGVGEDDE